MKKKRDDYRDRGIERQARKHDKRQKKRSLRDIRDIINEQKDGSFDQYDIEDCLEEE